MLAGPKWTQGKVVVGDVNPADSAVERFQKAHRITVRDNVDVGNVVKNREVLRFHRVQYEKHVF